MDYSGVLRQVNFVRLWGSQILSQVAQNLLNFALIILVYETTAGAHLGNISVSLLVLSFGIPSIIFSPVAGTYVDYWDRKKVLVICNFARAALVPFYLLVSHNFILILILSFIISTATQFFLPAEAATIPNVTPREHLLTANSLFVFALYASFIVGYSASGPVIDAFGNAGPYVATGVMFLVAGFLVTLLPPQPVKRPQTTLPKPYIWRHIKQNWQVITAKPDLHFSILQTTIIQGLVFMLLTLAPALSLALLHVPLQKASHALIIPTGVGMVLGVLLIHHIAKRRTKADIIRFGLVVAGLGLMALGLTGQLYRMDDGHTLVPTWWIPYIVGSIMLVLGFVNAMISTAAQTLIQESTTDETRGKVFGSLGMMINAAATLPILVTGVLADLLSPTKVLDLLGAALTIYAVFIYWRYSSSQIMPGNHKNPPATKS